MSEAATTIVAALIGAVVGSGGAVLLAYILTQASEKRRRRDLLVQQYLFQLQDAIAMLWYRLQNLAFRQRRSYMEEEYGSDEYYMLTTMYAIGRVLALGRIFVLEAVYPQLDAAYPKLSKFIREFKFDLNLLSFQVFRYERYLLAEAVMEHEMDLFRTSTFLEFRQRYEAGKYKEWLKSAIHAIDSLTREWMVEQMIALQLLEYQMTMTKNAHIVSVIRSLAERDEYFSFLQEATLNEVRSTVTPAIMKQHSRIRNLYQLLAHNVGKQLSMQERVLIGLVDEISDDELRKIRGTSQRPSGDEEEIAEYYLKRRAREQVPQSLQN